MRFIKIRKNLTIIFFFLFFNSFVHADINFATSIPKEFYFKLSPKDSSGFNKNLFEAFVDGDTKRKDNIKKKYKKWFKAELFTDKYNPIQTKIRLMGNWKDHLRPPISSLKVKIIDDNNVSGMRRFRLFLPRTRNNDNEIFFTTILRYVGFPSYYSSNVDVKFNGKIYKAILQEDASKEFLERNFIQELPILKIDEYNYNKDEESLEYYNNQKIKNSYIIENRKFLKKNYAEEIVSNAIYLANSDTFKNRVHNNTFFESLMLKYAKHALPEHNRRYIYVPYTNTFIPLYYDGNVNFPILEEKKNCKILNSLISKFENFKNEYYVLSKKNLSKKMECIAVEILNSYEEMHKEGNLFQENQINEEIKFSKNFLLLTKKIKDFINNNEPIFSIENKNHGYSYSFMYNKKFYKCFLKFNVDDILGCVELAKKDYDKILSRGQKLKKNSTSIKLANINIGNLDYYDNVRFLKFDKDKENIDYNINKKFIYILNVEKNIKPKKITVKFQHLDSKLIITGDLSNHEIILKNEIDIANLNFLPGNDINYLNGCTSIISAKLSNTKIYASNFHCEDALNIIKSEGNIDNIEIKDSLFDAVDFDFSDLNISNIKIKKAGNDCLDLSFGNYQVKKGEFLECHDKGVSLGEKSKGDFDNIKILDSKYGLVSKDSSIANIFKLSGENISKFCLSAYKKKQEFGGGKINYTNVKCNKEFYNDEFSIITRN